MFHISGMVEGSLFHAIKRGNLVTDKWVVTICDAPTGVEQTVEWTDQELASTMALLIGGDEMPGSDRLYPIAEQAASKVESQMASRFASAFTLRLIP